MDHRKQDFSGITHKLTEPSNDSKCLSGIKWAKPIPRVSIDYTGFGPTICYPDHGSIVSDSQYFPRGIEKEVIMEQNIMVYVVGSTDVL